VRPVLVDAHHHLWPADVVPAQPWQPPGATLRRAFEPADLLPGLAATGVRATVVMQSVDDAAENARLAAYAAATEQVRGVVAWAPLDRPAEAGRVVDALLADRAAGVPVVGVRYLAGTAPMTAATEGAGLDVLRRLAAQGLAWDVVPVTAQQRADVVRAARAVPDLRVVVDHLAAPPLADDDAAAWEGALADLAACPNVAVKLSVGVAVLVRWAAWDPARLADWVRRALAAFGPGRAMAATNWPVVELRASYARAWGDVRAAVEAELAPAEVAEVLGGTAARWYGLDLGPAGGTDGGARG